MHLLKFTLIICSFAGCWYPASWTSLFKNIIYKTYTMFLVSSLCTFVLSQFMNLIMNVGNSNELTETLYMMLTVLVAAYKQIFMWVKRTNVNVIINVLTKKPFKPSELHEIMIRQKFDKMIHNNTLRYLMLIISSITSLILTSIFTEFVKGNLAYRAWVPFDYSTPTLFSLVFTYQLIAMSTSGIVNAACDSLISGFLLHICCQLEILEYRLSKVVHVPNILRDCIHHHNQIFQYAYVVNNMFTKIITIQFAVSFLVVCSNLYRIAMAEDYMKFIPLMFYTGAILAQIFLYCWFGNEVKLKSLHLAESIYNTEWLALDGNTRKILLFTMKRAIRPIEFSSTHIIILNLDSFVGLLKMSYSAFNLLHRTQD